VKAMRLRWAILRLIWESKGYSMKEMPDLLQARFPGQPGFAFASVQRKAQEGQEAPEDVVGFITDAQALPVRPGYEAPAEFVRLALEALDGQQVQPEPHELALALLAHFPTDEIALKLAEALTKQGWLDALGRKVEALVGGAGASLTSLGDSLQTLASSVRDGLNAFALSGSHLDAVRSRVDDMAESLDDRMDILELEFDNADEHRAQDTRNILRAIHRWGVFVVGCIAVLAVVLLVRTSSPAEKAPEKVLSSAQDGGQAAAAARSIRKALPMPKNGVPNQQAAPCPPYEELNGHCWEKKTLTETQVKDGACEKLRLYELSPGWCRAHKAGYLPVYDGHTDNNAVDPQ